MPHLPRFGYLKCAGLSALIFVVMQCIGSNARAVTVSYDPLAVTDSFHPEARDLSVHDAVRNRDIPIRIYLPAGTTPAPVLLFSHGLGGSRAGSSYLGRHWAARGYATVYVQHPGSDETVLKSIPPMERMAAFVEAASPANFLLRVQDISTVIDQLTLWNNDQTSPLAGRFDLNKIGMSGHSFGAITTEALSGEQLTSVGKKFNDPRIKAAVIMSPSPPHGITPKEAFSSVTVPWMLMTGTRDVSPIGNANVASRLTVYPAVHGAPKYELVLNNAEHSVFTETVLPRDRQPRNPNHHRVILALSTAFWDAYLRHDSAALEWLNGVGPRTVMENADHWQFSAK